MTKRKLKPFVLPTIYALSVIMLVLSMYLIQGIISNSLFNASEMKNEIKYVDGEITDNIDQELPVVSTKTKINRPKNKTPKTNPNVSFKLAIPPTSSLFSKS